MTRLNCRGYRVYFSETERAVLAHGTNARRGTPTALHMLSPRAAILLFGSLNFKESMKELRRNRTKRTRKITYMQSKKPSQSLFIKNVQAYCQCTAKKRFLYLGLNFDSKFTAIFSALLTSVRLPFSEL